MRRTSTWSRFRLRSLLLFMALIAAFFADRKSHEQFPDIAALFRNQPATAPICVAGRDIRVGERIRATDVVVEIWPADKIPANTIVNVKDALGARPRVALYTGEVLLLAQVPDCGAANNSSKSTRYRQTRVPRGREG